MTTTAKPAAPPRPGLWLRMSVGAGNSLQLAGIVVGGAFLYLAANVQSASGVRVAMMLFGFVMIYDCCHAIAHWAVGRLAGIRFRGYGLRGTDHPETYPPGVRQIMAAMPFFTAMTEKRSMNMASPLSRALMFAAGETSTTVFSILAGLYAWQSDTPGGFTLFVVMVVWSLAATVATAITPRGDYAKAIKVLRVQR